MQGLSFLGWARKLKGSLAALDLSSPVVSPKGRPPPNSHWIYTMFRCLTECRPAWVWPETALKRFWPEAARKRSFPLGQRALAPAPEATASAPCLRRRVALSGFGLALLLGSSGLWAQGIKRPFPANALRGELVVRLSPEVELNGRPQRLAPGARVRSEANLLVMPATLMGSPLVVNYTLDGLGQVKEVWILSPAERAQQPWPTRPEQSSRWQFDPLTQTWTPR
jgi:hypothetical protein